MSNFSVRICALGLGCKKFISNIDEQAKEFKLTDDKDEALVYTDVDKLMHDINRCEEWNIRRERLFVFE